MSVNKTFFSVCVNLSNYELVFSLIVVHVVYCCCCLFRPRLVLLLQVMGTFLETSCSKMGIRSGSSTASTSVGPVVKKYWSRMLQLCTSLTQTVSQVSSVYCVIIIIIIIITNVNFYTAA